MNNIPAIHKRYSVAVAFNTLMLLLPAVCPFTSTAQATRALPGEAATCTVKRSGTQAANGKANAGIKTPAKTYVMKPNQLGNFDRLSGIQPLEIVPVEIAYPNGQKGEKVLLSAKDGGWFDNGKKVNIAALNARKMIAFNFQVSGQSGIFRIGVRKGNDVKVVQLWVGADPSATSN